MKSPAKPKPKTLPEEAPHVAVLLRRLPTADERLRLVHGVEAKARSQVKAAGAKLTGAKSAELAALHRQVAEADDDDLAVLYLRRSELPPTLAAHVDLLRACLAAREGGEPRDFADWIMLAMSRADPLIEKGALFQSNGRGRGPIRKLIDKEFKHLSGKTPIQAWGWLSKLPARRRQGFEFTENTENGSATKAGYPPIAFKTFSNQLRLARTENTTDG